MLAEPPPPPENFGIAVLAYAPLRGRPPRAARVPGGGGVLSCTCFCCFAAAAWRIPTELSYRDRARGSQAESSFLAHCPRFGGCRHSVRPGSEVLAGNPAAAVQGNPMTLRALRVRTDTPAALCRRGLAAARRTRRDDAAGSALPPMSRATVPGVSRPN